jgi:redox-sensitive bicupin YhaK (pirin superfamily)
MNIFAMKTQAMESEEGEYIVGAEDTGSHACYMIYGAMKPHEKGRLLKPGEGHEEIVLSVKGDIEVTGHWSGTLREGTAFHLTGDKECYLENKGHSDAVYIIAGGHSEEGHH